MKNLKYIALILFPISLMLVSCGDDLGKNSVCDHITINIKNETGIDIQNFQYAETNHGIFSAGEEIINICLDGLTIDGTFPMIYFTGIMDGDEIKSIAGAHWCGTGMFTVTEGTFNIELLERSEWDEQYVIYESIEE